MTRMGRSCIALAVCAACGGGSNASLDATSSRDSAAVDAQVVLEEVHLIGRFDQTNRFAWPGTQIVTRFDGTAIAVELDDGGQSWLEITIDGTARAPLQLGAGRATYMLATGLAAGTHDLVIARRTESFFGPTTFFGFPGATLIATPRPTRLVEMIGDSITCGYGVLGAGPTCSFSAATEAEPHAWGTFAAAQLGAAHVSIAYSGIGMARNGDGSTTDTMPERYPRTFADDAASTWSFNYSPDVIVINLGTNDFAPGDPGQAFVTSYVSFVQMLRGHFPHAQVMLATSPMLTDSYPAGAMSRTKARGYLDTIAAMLADPNVHVVEIAEQLPADGYGCDYHPNEVTEHKMADALVPAIRAATGW
jgi:lysophospholipase L1-like esterase